jgi:hypothetical protein
MKNLMDIETQKGLGSVRSNVETTNFLDIMKEVGQLKHDLPLVLSRKVVSRNWYYKLVFRLPAKFGRSNLLQDAVVL